MMYDIHYDTNSGRILGFYLKGVSVQIPSPTIKVSEETKKEVERKPHRFQIVDRKLQEAKSDINSINKVRRDVGEFIFNDAIYVADRMFLSNLSLNLSISTSSPNHSCKFWCMVNGEFQKRNHDADELMQLAKTYENSRSESLGD